MATLEIKADDFMLGETSSDYAQDGGFSPDSFNLNLIKEKGVLHFNTTTTDIGDTTLTGNIVASCPDPALSGNHGYFVDDESAFYRYDGSSFTKVITGGNTYQLGSSEMIPFNNGNFYATSRESIAEFDNDIGTLTENWWSGLNSNYRHPMEVVEDNIFFGDKNLVYYYDGTTSGTAFTLPSGQNVTSLRKHPLGS